MRGKRVVTGGTSTRAERVAMGGKRVAMGGKGVSGSGGRGAKGITGRKGIRRSNDRGSSGSGGGGRAGGDGGRGGGGSSRGGRAGGDGGRRRLILKAPHVLAGKGVLAGLLVKVIKITLGHGAVPAFSKIRKRVILGAAGRLLERVKGVGGGAGARGCLRLEPAKALRGAKGPEGVITKGVGGRGL